VIKNLNYSKKYFALLDHLLSEFHGTDKFIEGVGGFDTYIVVHGVH
jgi:hypothetical protein